MTTVNDVRSGLVTRVQQLKMQMQNKQNELARINETIEQIKADLNALDGAIQAHEETLKFLNEDTTTQDNAKEGSSVCEADKSPEASN